MDLLLLEEVTIPPPILLETILVVRIMIAAKEK
jgi:hypothetical protein